MAWFKPGGPAATATRIWRWSQNESSSLCGIYTQVLGNHEASGSSIQGNCGFLPDLLTRGTEQEILGSYTEVPQWMLR